LVELASAGAGIKICLAEFPNGEDFVGFLVTVHEARLISYLRPAFAMLG